ncbi:MAG: subclass B1 metallo-beta-lactamase [Lewinella sp.]|jgi:metallo-beta-lactamase class B|uniref:subclass B1 metallo-beta-lactamase n=1 Tax=Lewinella sp. TaxID=2004506 RepID=UPI003D6ABA9B
MHKLFTLLLVLIGCNVVLHAQQPAVQQIGEDIQLIRLTDNTFIHRSFKVFEGYGRIGSNGLIYMVDSTCVIFDTPVTTKTTVRLLDYLTKEQGFTVQAVVVNHFHEDCTAGLDSVQARGILTYGSKKTVALCEAEGTTAPQKKFGRKKVIKLGDQQIVNYAPGPGHTVDNIVSYLPTEGVLFGGCLIKSLGAGRGNTNDAVVSKWSDTVERVQKKFPEAIHIIPGHGHAGGPELLEFTVELFAEDRLKK